MKNHSLSLFAQRAALRSTESSVPTTRSLSIKAMAGTRVILSRTCAFRMFCLALVLVCVFNGRGLAQGPPPIAGHGTADFIPRWTGPTTLGNSTIFQTVSGNVGVGTTNPAAKLDVQGAFAIHGTNFSITNTGRVNFVSGQTFPGTGTITGVTAGTGISGGGTSGNVPVSLDTGFTDGRYGQLGAVNTWTNRQAFSGEIDAAGNYFGQGVVTGTQIAGSEGGEFSQTSNAPAIAGANNGSTYTLSLINRATPSSSNFTEAQFNVNGTATFFTDTLGNTTAIGTKHAAVPLANGKMVDVFSMESPEVWFEDFGSGQLLGGITTVAIDPSFRQTVTTANGYHVFVTPKGDCKGLYITNETTNSFEIRELSGGQSSVEFDYRIVAHRKGYEKSRLPAAKMPKPMVPQVLPHIQ